MTRQGIFSRRALLWLSGLAVLSFLLSFFLVGYGEDLAPARSLGADTYSLSAIGHRGLRSFLERLDLQVFVSRDLWPTEIAENVALVAAEPVPGISVEGYGLAEARQAADFGGARFVLVLPKWQGMSDSGGRRLVQVAPIRKEAVGETLAPVLEDVPYSPAEAVRRLRGKQEISCVGEDGSVYRMDVREPQLLVLPEAFRPVVTCEDMTLVASLPATEDRAETWVVSDPDILNNHGLLRGDHAALVRDLFVDFLDVDVVVFDEMLHGYGSGARLIAELVRFPLVLVVIHGLLLSGLVVWSGSVRFGQPRTSGPRFGDGKLVLIDNAAKLLGLGGHSREALKQYYEQTLRAVGANYFLPPDLKLGELEGRLQALSRSRGLQVELLELRQRIDAAARKRSHSEHAVRLARQLHHWRCEMTHAR